MSLDTRDTTPEARLETAKRMLSDAVSEMVKAYMAQGAAKSEWVDQKNSPLGRRRHCDLAREKKLPSVKDGRRVLIKRSDIDAYLKSKQVVSIDEDAEFEAEAKRLAAEMGDG